MRMLMKVRMDTEAANRAVRDGSMTKALQSTIEQLKPEAAYFTTSEGARAAYIVFDMKDPAEMPPVAEPFFLNLNAEVDFSPVMNAEDVMSGVQAATR